MQVKFVRLNSNEVLCIFVNMYSIVGDIVNNLKTLAIRLVHQKSTVTEKTNFDMYYISSKEELTELKLKEIKLAISNSIKCGKLECLDVVNN